MIPPQFDYVKASTVDEAITRAQELIKSRFETWVWTQLR